MSEKRAGGILVSSFVAGTLVAAAVFAPSAWEPVPGPYFGLDERATPSPQQADAPDAGMEAAHAELSARAMATQPQSRPAPVVAMVQPPRDVLVAEVASSTTTTTITTTTASAAAETAAPQHRADQEPASSLAAQAVSRPSTEPPAGPPPRPVALPPERVALADASSPAAVNALAQALPAASPTPATSAPSGPPGTQVADPQDAVPAPVPTPPESLKAMVSRMQAAQPAVPRPAAPSAAVPPAPTPPPAPRSWLQTVVEPRALEGFPGGSGAVSDSQPRKVVANATAVPLGVAPLPGGPWTDPDAANWSEIPASAASGDSGTWRWFGDRRAEQAGSDSGASDQRATVPIGGRLLDRLRGSDRRTARTPELGGETVAIDATLPDIGRWPHPARLEQQFEHLSSGAGAAAGEPLGGWIGQTRAALTVVLETRGPRDAAADSSLVSLGECVLAGMSLADTTADAGLASHTRRAALAVARRVAVWRAAAALCPEIQRQRDADGDASAAMTRQAAGRALAEIARLLHALERFEIEPSAADALVVKTALASVSGFYPTAARGLMRSVEDHYAAPNVRIAVHQQFMEKLLPGATVDTAPFQDVVMGREVRGTRRVERTTTLRLVPDDDEISFNLEVHGDIASRSTTESGPVLVTARSASAFTVRKPIKISPQGLLFGNAAGVASNRSHVDAIQTSFDGVPVMGSLVRNIAKNQQAEAMPEANREVIDKIVSRACREVDSQSEPQFAEMAERVRSRVWAPLVNLGLEPTAVAMETSSTQATMRLRLAAHTQLAAHTPRPRAPAAAMLSLQVHESTVNNLAESLELSGRRVSLEELIRLVCGKFGVEPRIPDDLPEGVAVSFAESQPLRVECRDGLVHVRVKLDSIESGRRDWVGIVAHVAYRPVCKGPQVFLEREGPIRLSGPGHEGRMELGLRTIFGKIFPKERPIALLPEQVVANPRLTGVQAVQAVGSDGWLAIALEQATTAQPTPTPAGQRAAETRRKIIFR